MLATASNQVLAARSCDWNPRYHGAATPVLRTDGTLANHIATARSGGGGILPTVIEIPVGQPPKDYGRFIVRTDPNTDISLEERHAAATIANTLSRCLGR